MRFSKRHAIFFVMLFAFSGCVTSHYKNDKGCDCTRRYFTPFGISVKSCSETPPEAAEPAMVQGEELNVPPMAPSPSLRQSTPAKAIEQNIKSTTRALR